MHRNGEHQSYSARWHELAELEDVSTLAVDVFSEGALDDIAGCDAFMWRCGPGANPRLFAKRLLYAVETGLGVPVFPSLKTLWHFEDKIAQHYYLSLSGIPTPQTHVFWDRDQAIAFSASAEYPFVIKLSSGYQASNVRLVQNRTEALFYIDQMFGPGIVSLGYKPASRVRRALRRVRAAAEVGRGRYPHSPNAETELQHGYFLAQAFLPRNEFDIRVTVIGNRIFAFRRLNRPGDFRASGSGRIDWDPAAIDSRALRLALRTAYQTQAQTVAVDIIFRDDEPVVVELTFSYASWAVRDCPGHWVLHGDVDRGELVWTEGSVRPEDAIFADFLSEIRRASRDTQRTRPPGTHYAALAGE